jgi:1-deoxy-D-xylulose-5-phosphate synthase
MRFIKPLDTCLLTALSEDHELFVTLEDNAIMGGAGSAVNEYVQTNKLDVKTLNLGIPDEFIKHGTQQEMNEVMGLDSQGILASIKNW